MSHKLLDEKGVKNFVCWPLIPTISAETNYRGHRGDPQHMILVDDGAVCFHTVRYSCAHD